MKLNKAIKNRWSPRAFSEKKINDEELNSLFEAARWAPSSMNEQPWQYFYARKEDGKVFDKFINCLKPGNQIWAKNAQVIILSVFQKKYKYKNRPNRVALHDMGAANLSLAIQAAESGFQVHQMGGFDMDKTIETFNLSKEEFEPASFIAVGYPGEPAQLPDDLKKDEIATRERKEIEEFVTKIS